MTPELSIIIPAYNEAGRLPATFARLKEDIAKLPIKVEVLVVNDGSTDATLATIQSAQANFPELTYYDQQPNQGKGAAVRAGMLKSTAAWRLFMDADYATPLSELTKLWAFTGEFPVIIGTRHMEKDSIKVKQSLQRRVISRAGNLFIQSMVLPGIIDTQCGFKLFRGDAADAIFARQTMYGWAFDVEILTIAQGLGYAIKEVPVDWYDAKDSKLRAAHAAYRTMRDVWTIRRRRKSGAYH